MDEVELATITIRLMATEDGGMSVEVETEGEPSAVLGFGMLEMAKAEFWSQLDDD